MDTTAAPGAAGERPAALVGNTPVTRIGEPFAPPGHGFWAKLEGFNPGGMKDRPALHMVERARARGDLQPGARIIESTSGTLGLGLALAGIAYDHPVTLVTDPGLEPILTQMLLAHGARVDVVSAPHPAGGWQQARRDRVEQLLAAEPTAWCPDQYTNPDNVDAYRALALELLTQLGHIDVLVCSVGTGGHSAGISRTLRQFLPDLELVGVDTIGSTIFGQPARPRLMRGLGSSIYPDNVDYTAFSEVHWIAPSEAVWACRELAATHYATGGWSVGAVALTAGWIAAHRTPDTVVVGIFPDGPQRYYGTIYNDIYCAENNIDPNQRPQGPKDLAHPDDVVTAWTRTTHVVDPVSTR
ncbi:MAG: PLP-dependent cysteine synthase family protein [Gordonia polyisoprenivorans]|nr:PLP-dependent cysteine synthase family protein [Gordonia polyisoprenivorans]